MTPSPPPSQPPAVLITWIDACSDPFYDGPATAAGDLAVMQRVGFFLGKKKSCGVWCLVFAAERHPETGGVREPIAIPEKWVTSITPLSAEPQRTKRGRARERS